MIGRRFGPDVVEGIQRMTAIGLERDLLNGKMQVAPMLLPPEETQGRMTLALGLTANS